MLLGDLYLSPQRFKWFPHVVIWGKILTAIMLASSKLFGASDGLITFIGCGIILIKWLADFRPYRAKGSKALSEGKVAPENS